MSNMKLKLKNEEIQVKVNKKPIKNVHLKVSRDYSVTLSTPIYVPDEWIKKFLLEKASWIEKHMYKYKQSEGQDNLECLRNGSTVQILGKDYRVYIKKGENKISKDEKNLIIYTQNINDQEKLDKMFRKWWRQESLIIYKEISVRIYKDIFKKYNVLFPEINVRKMKTMWGSCNPGKRKIVFNEYLYKASISEIEYVVLHEFTHLLYPNHDKDFYNFLTIHMPDWMERKYILDHEVAQGL